MARQWPSFQSLFVSRRFHRRSIRKRNDCLFSERPQRIEATNVVAAAFAEIYRNKSIVFTTRLSVQ
jgi:hypothetical protein